MAVINISLAIGAVLFATYHIVKIIANKNNDSTDSSEASESDVAAAVCLEEIVETNTSEQNTIEIVSIISNPPTGTETVTSNHSSDHHSLQNTAPTTAETNPSTDIDEQLPNVISADHVVVATEVRRVVIPSCADTYTAFDIDRPNNDDTIQR